MAPTSGTYNFQSIQVELIIREAYERIGILGEFVESQKLESAKRSIDLLLLEWMNEGVNLWTLEYTYLPLITAQAQYTLPITVSDITQANLRTSNRQTTPAGVPSSNTGTTNDGGGGGVAAQAFDGNTLTACTQTVTNGNISYDYGVGNNQQITFVGIQSNSNTLYSIVIESSLDLALWTPLLVVTPQNFVKGITLWVDIPTPSSARAYRIRETAGATLNIQEIYFNNNTLDMPVSDVSRYEYLTYPNKQLQGRPSVYYLNRKLPPPVLSIWPVPSNLYNCLQYSYKKMMQDVGEFYTNTVDVPSRFYPALVWGLSYQLAIKFRPEIAQIMEAEYRKSFMLAFQEDSERVPININGDYTMDYYR